MDGSRLLHQRMKTARHYGASVYNGHADVCAVLLVGSLSKMRSTPTSDIDLVIVRQPFSEGYSYRPVDYAGEIIGVETFDATRISTVYASSPLLDPKALREAGRLATSAVLFSRWKHLDAFLDRCAHTVLHPHFALDYFISTEQDLHTLRTLREPCERTWTVHSIFLSLSVLALNGTRSKYQKPKWAMADLRAYATRAMLRLADAVLPVERCSAAALQSLITRINVLLNEAVQAMNLPPFTHSISQDDLYDYLRGTYFDGEDMLNLGDYAATLYIKIICIRMTAMLMEEKSMDPAFIDGWRRSCMKAFNEMTGDDGPLPPTLIKDMTAVRRSLLSSYKKITGAVQKKEPLPYTDSHRSVS